MCTKRLLLSAVITCFIFLSASSQTLFTYGTKTATKEEFLKAYNKNPDTTNNQSQKLKEYLDMYVNFRLKLQAAYDEKLNTNETLQAEAENFKAQLAENIINEQADISQLLHEAFLRSQKDIKLAQVFVAVPAGSDTTDAYAQIKRAYADLNTGKSFEEVTVAYSTDTSVIAAKGNIGYITVFTLPYQIENIVYGLQPGKYSNIYRSGIGYHIFKNGQERPATGKRKIQQLMFPTPPFFTDEQKQAVAKETDSVYNLLKQGTSFAEMMKTYNREDDNDPNATIDVSVGQYNSDFEDHVFALQSQGDISMPFTTAYGYNIIKLIEILAVNKNESDVINTAHLQEQIQTDNRLNVAKQKLADKWLTEIKYKPAAYNAEDLWAFTDSMIQGKNLPTGYKGIKSTTVLFQFEKQKITADDWIKFAGMARESEEPYNDASYSDLMKEFVRQSAANYYKQHIEDYYPSIKEQMKEFNDANLLFSVMDNHIWNKASEDSAGLKKYYDANKQKYMWQASVTALIVSGPNKKIINDISNKIKANPADWRNITSSDKTIVADSSRFESDQLPVKQQVSLQKDFQTTPESNEAGDTYTFIHIFNIFPQPSQRSFDEARGMVINDYQQVLEEKWLSELKKKYPVKVNDSVLKTIE